MAVEVASLKAVLSLDKANFDNGLKQSKGAIAGFASQFASGIGAGLGISAFGAGAAALNLFKDAITSSIGAAREAVAVDKELVAVIASTGGVAGVTADAARELASSLSEVTNFQDDTILSAESMLLTFTKIGKEVFPEATEAVLNLAEKFGNAETAAVQVGKALNDPIKGVTALQRVGVTFSAAQKQQVKDFMAVNDIAGAQGVILKELGTEFGGLARAAADPLTQLQNAVGEIAEALGGPLLTILNTYAQIILPAVRAVAEGLGAAFSTAAEPVSAVSKALQATAQAAIGLGSAFQGLGFGMVEVGGKGSEMASGLARVGQEFTPFQAIVKQAQGVFLDLVHSVGDVARRLRDVAVSLGLVSKGTSATTVVLAPLMAMFRISIAFWGTVASGIAFVAHTFEALAFVIDRVKQGWNNLTIGVQAANAASRVATTAWQSLVIIGSTLMGWINRLIAGWQRLTSTMSQPVNLPPNLTPGSPTPLELGIRGIASAINDMPSLSNAFADNTVPSASTSSATTNNNYYQIGSVSASSIGTQDTHLQAVGNALRMLKEQLVAAPGK